MSNTLSDSISNLKKDSSVENKKNFVSALISEKYFVPVVVEADEKTHNITKMSYYSISSETGSYLLAFTSVEAIGAWRKDVQFLELSFNDVSSLMNIEGAQYAGIEIDHDGNNLGLKKDFINKIKGHIKSKK